MWRCWDLLSRCVAIENHLMRSNTEISPNIDSIAYILTFMNTSSDVETALSSTASIFPSGNMGRRVLGNFIQIVNGIHCDDVRPERSSILSRHARSWWSAHNKVIHWQCKTTGSRCVHYREEKSSISWLHMKTGERVQAKCAVRYLLIKTRTLQCNTYREREEQKAHLTICDDTIS